MRRGGRSAAFAIALAVSMMSTSVRAQQDQTLADIRQDLSVLYVEIQKLKRELSTTGAPSVRLSGESVIDRANSIEAALQDLTGRTERLELRINEIVRDGTNRIGDLEFRLVELEGGDISQLGETTTLGGDVAVAAPSAPAPEVELAIGERADFDAAVTALGETRYREAADGFSRFLDAYPGSPLSAQAHVNRGKALSGLQDTREAARSYLAGFSADPTGPVAAEALALLGGSLGTLGQVDQACLTLAEVSIRFPKAEAVGEARQEMEALGCT